MLDALMKLGIPRFEDQNIPNPYGVAPRASNIKNGQRQSAAVAYLESARKRANLTIIDEAQVTSLVLDGNKAKWVPGKGIEVSTQNKRFSLQFGMTEVDDRTQTISVAKEDQDRNREIDGGDLFQHAKCVRIR